MVLSHYCLHSDQQALVDLPQVQPHHLLLKQERLDVSKNPERVFLD